MAVAEVSNLGLSSLVLGSDSPNIAVDYDSANHGRAEAIVVADAHLLFAGDFKRSGLDLVISKDDRQVVIDDYFKGEKRAALATPDGAMLSGKLVDALTGEVQYAQAGASTSAAAVIGKVSKAAGVATVIRNGVSVQLNVGDDVHKGDVVQAGSNSSLVLVFIDGTVFGLAANSRMVLNEMVYDPNGSSNSSLLSLVQGTITFVAGETAKRGDMKVETPAATMGIRGTAVLAEIGFVVPGVGGTPPVRVQVLVEPGNVTGSFLLYSRSDPSRVIGQVDRAGQVTSVTGSGDVSTQTAPPLSQNALAIIEQTLREYFPNYTPRTNNPPSGSSTPPGTGPLINPNDIDPINFPIGVPTTVPLRADFLPGGPDLTVTITQFNTPPQINVNNVVVDVRTAAGSPGFSIADRITIVDPDTTNPAFNDIPVPYVPGTARLLSATGPASASGIDLAALIRIDPETGAVSYDPAGFAFLAQGASVTYTIAFDSRSGPDTLHQTLTVTIDGVNDAPVITSAAIVVGEGGSVVLAASSIGISDPDGTDFTFTVSNVTHGRFEILSGGLWTVAATFTSADLNAGHVRFVHDGSDGAPTFSIQANDGFDASSVFTSPIGVIEAVPTAASNSNSGAEGGIVTGNVLSNDVFGADGPAATIPAGGVTGVAAGSNTSSPVSGGVGAPIAGNFGVLTLNADGTYSYDGNASVVPPAGATDTFVYTITDSDGDTSTVTLTITLTDAGLATSGDDLTVNEAALATGSNPSSVAETVTGTLADNVTPGVAPYTYVLLSNPTGTHGTLTLNPDGSYSYTLTSPVDGATSNDGVTTENNVETFTYKVIDANGNTAISTITIDVIDDVPTATADTRSVVEGGIVTGNVLTDGPGDVFGADGAAASESAGGVTGVAAGSNTSSPVSGALGVPVEGSFGVLTLNADGTYSYEGDPNVVPPAGATDTFVYTITDGDGDTSTVTLTITLTASGLAASGDDLTVNEAALATGSDPSSVAEKVTGTLADNVTPGVAPYTYALLSDPTGTHGTLTLNPDGSYSYKLTSPVDGATSNNGITTENNVETFTYQVTDANGNTATSTITIDVIDDVPVVEANTATVAGSASQTVDVQFIVDMSGSMFTGGVSGVPTFDDNRAGLARYAMLQLLEGNEQIQNVEFVAFGSSGSASGSVWMDRAAAIAYVNNDANWVNRGSTDYDLALQTAINSFGSSRPLPAGQQTFVYFLSDGEPSSGIDTNGAGANVSIAEWEGHLATQGIDQVFALGIGTASASALNPIAYPKVDPPGAPVQYENVILVSTANVEDLPNTFQDLLGLHSLVSGNILLDDPSGTGADSFGADGGRILSITVNGVTYVYLPETNQIDPSTGPNIAGSTLTVLTALGGTFTFNFAASGPDAAGSWSYLTDDPGAESFSYVLQDNDGDQVSSSLHIAITAANRAPSSSSDSVATSEDATIILALSDFGNYADAEGTPIASVRVTTLESNGSLEFDTTGAGAWAAVTLNQDIAAGDISAGRLRFVPDANENGAPYTMVGFRVSDGSALSAGSYTLTVNVTAVNDAPVTNPDTVITNVGANAAVAIPTAWLLANDTDLESGVPSTVAGVGGASDGSVSGPSGGNVTFTDNATLDGSFTYQANDGSMSGGTGSVTVDNHATSTTTLVGGAGSEIFIGGATNDAIRGGGGNDFINGAGGTDLLDFSDGAAGIALTLVQSSSDTVVNLSAAGLGTDTYRNMEGVIGTSFADTITASAAGSIVKTGAGGDTVNINAGAAGSSWTVDLGADQAQDKVVFTHAALGTSDNTVATVFSFNVANDRIAVTLGAAAIADGAFQTATATQTTISAGVEVVELVNAAFVTASLTDDSNNGTVESIIAAATNGIATGNYTFVIYSDTTGAANAGIYSVNISDSTDPTAGSDMVVEHIMTLNGVGYGNLADANFVSAADPLIFDLGAPGLAFTGVADGVSFDINADGARDQMAWTTGQDGILALDVNGNGAIDNGAEIFSPYFAGGEFASGLAALASLDSNDDGRIDANDGSFAHLALWQDTNHDGVSQANELAGLADHGITSIDLHATPADTTIDGQQVLSVGTFTTAGGGSGTFIEAAFDSRLAPDANEGVATAVPDGASAATAQTTLEALAGSSGADNFVFAANMGSAVIRDFTPGQDHIDLSGIVTTNNVDEWMASHVAESPVNGLDTLISLDDHATITLQNVAATHLHASDFIVHSNASA